MKVVQLFTRESRNLRDFDAMNAEHRDAWIDSIRYDAALFAAVEIAGGISVAVIVGYGAGFATAGTLYVFIDWMRRFFLPLRDLSAKYSVMQSAMASTERIFQLLDTEPAIQDRAGAVRRTGEDRNPEEDRARSSSRTSGSRTRTRTGCCKDVSFRVAPGERVALVGSTGAGKTSIIKLLDRLYDVTRGRILIDGVDLRDMPQRELRQRVAMVLQDVFLFSGTVASNIGARAARRLARRHRARRPRGRGAPLRRAPAARLRHRAARARQRSLRRPAPAALVRPRARARRRRAGARRGDQLDRLRDRAAHPARHPRADRGPHRDRDRPPPLDDPGRRPHLRAAQRPHRRDRHATTSCSRSAAPTAGSTGSSIERGPEPVRAAADAGRRGGAGPSGP